MRVLVLATSYPRHPGDFAGLFVRDAVEHLRARGVEVEVVSPASFRHYGIAFGDGVVNNLRAKKWRVLLLPLFFLGFARAARNAARDVDVVHAHWLPSVVAGIATRKPLVVQLWGTDVELAKRMPRLSRRLLRSAEIVVCASTALAADARALGARAVRVIPSGITIPDTTAEPEEPPHVLFIGRLSEEKGIRDLVEAAEGLPLVVVGDGPLRNLVPDAVGFVLHDELGSYYERAAVVCVPSRREGYGMTAREAMAHGRAVVATGVGGLAEAIDDGVNGLVVAPGDPAALRDALERLLADADLRARLGEAAREKARVSYAWPAATAATIAAYEDALRQ